MVEGRVSILLVLAGIGLSGLVCWRALRAQDAALRRPHRAQRRLARAGYSFLVNKYYLDFLYEKGIVAGIRGPIARAA